MKRGRAVGALALLVVPLVLNCPGFREDELECEEAYAHLEDCCGDMQGAISCEFEHEGCNTTTPAMSVEESKCVRDKSCTELHRDGLCDPELWRQGNGGSPRCR